MFYHAAPLAADYFYQPYLHRSDTHTLNGRASSVNEYGRCSAWFAILLFMTILFITRKFPPSTGGMENFAYELYTALSKETDVRLIKWGGSNKYLPVVLPYFLLRACWLLLRGGIDVVHVQDGVLAPLGYVLAKIFRKRFTIVVHGLDITYPNKLFQKVNVGTVGKADVVFCISRAAADEAQRRGVSEPKIMIIPLGITDDIYRSDEPLSVMLREELGIAKDAPVLLTVGRLVKRKGVAWFVMRVIPELIRKYPTLVYVVVGNGEDRDKIMGIIADKQLSKHVIMLGRVDDEKMPLLYNGADIFIQPNIVVPGDMEGFGKVLLEASLCELPIVATGIEGIQDAITDGKNGKLVAQPEDTGAFVAAIGTFLDDVRYAQSFGRKGRAYTLQHFQWSVIAGKYMHAFRKLTGQL